MLGSSVHHQDICQCCMSCNEIFHQYKIPLQKLVLDGHRILSELKFQHHMLLNMDPIQSNFPIHLQLEQVVLRYLHIFDRGTTVNYVKLKIFNSNMFHKTFQKLIDLILPYVFHILCQVQPVVIKSYMFHLSYTTVVNIFHLIVSTF